MKTTLFPTLQEALELHEHLLKRFGGGGVRDLGLLEGALHRPQTGYYETLSPQAAALMQSLAQNHAVVDGNKRVAFALTAIFLPMNGYRLSVGADPGEKFLSDEVIGASAGKRADLERIAAWIEKHMRAA